MGADVRAQMRPGLGALPESVLYVGAIAAAFLLAGAVVLYVDNYAWLAPFFVGVGLITYGAGALWRAANVTTWLKVQGKVLKSTLGEVLIPGSYGAYTEYYPVVQFEYWSPSGHFVSNKFTISPRDYRNADRTEVQQSLTPYPVGATTEVYVCPKDHRLVVLCPEVSARRRSQYHAALVGGALVSAISVWVALHAAP